MTYLDPSEYETYGLEKTVPAALVAAASSLLDAHCRRPTLGVAQYSERLRLRAGRNTCRLTYLPLATVAPASSPIVSARGRYGLPRRGEVSADFAAQLADAFQLPGTWTELDIASLDCDAATGDVTFTLNPLGLTFNEVEIAYNAGLAAIPDAVKFACAQLVRNMQATPALTVRSGVVDRMQMEYFAPTLLDDSVRALVAPYVAQKVG